MKLAIFSELVTRSIVAGGVGRVRSIFLDFGDDYWHKLAPTDPITNRISTYTFASTGL